MLLTVTTTRNPAQDLGYLLHKHPDRAQSFDLSFGTAHVCYPVVSDDVTTAALIIEVDPVGLVRRSGSRQTPEGFTLGQYVNDRPYAASSLLAVALSRVFRTAMSGRCDARPDLAAQPIPLTVHVPVLPCRGGPERAERLFGPLGWEVTATPIALDEAFPAWGASRYVDLRLTGSVRLADALNHLYVLLPVLDGSKHYWVSPDEVDKLIRAGGAWLAGHPEAAEITRAYLGRRTALTRAALARLAELDDAVDEGESIELDPSVPEVGDEPDRALPLHELRKGAVIAVLRAAGATRVGDLGCGEGALVTRLLDDPAITKVVATDVSARALEMLGRKLHLERMPERRRARLEVFQSSVLYRDARVSGLDALVLMEVVEHVDPPRLQSLALSVFGAAAPPTVVITTPNVEHNVRFEGLEPGARRHRDHRFEWTRDEFIAWCDEVATTHGYRWRAVPIGVDDPEVGPPTQMAVFTKIDVSAEAAS